MMLAGVSTTHNSNLQKLLPFTVPWFPYLHNVNMNIDKLLVAEKQNAKLCLPRLPLSSMDTSISHSGRIN